MASQTLLSRVVQMLSGIFLSLSGAWLWVVCLGGLLTLGVLSVLHLGILLSLGGVGMCLLIGGACLLCQGIFDSSKRHVLREEDASYLSPLANKLDRKGDSKKPVGVDGPLQSVRRSEETSNFSNQPALLKGHHRRDSF